MRLRTRLGLTLLLAALPLVAGVLWLRNTVEAARFDEQMREFALATMEAGGRERCEAAPERFLVDTLAPPPPPPAGRGPGPGEPQGLGAGRDAAGWRPALDAEPGPQGGEDPRPLPPGPPPRDPLRLGPPRPPGSMDGGWGEPGGRPGAPRPPPQGPGRMPALVLPPEQRGTRLFAYTAALTSAQPRAPAVPEGLAAGLRAGDASAGAEWRDGPHAGRQVALRTPWPDGPCAVLLVQRPWVRAPWYEDALLWGLVALAGGLLLVVMAAVGPLVRRIRRLGQEAAHSARTGYAERLHEQGHDELGELARTFAEAGREVRANLTTLEARERTLREFVSNTTHDVAIPLTVLQGHLARMRKRQKAGAEPEPDVQQDALDEAHYIACLLQNLSAVARMEAAPQSLERHPVDLVALVDRVLARHRPMAEGRDVTLVHAVSPLPLWAAGDVTLLEQAVSNLVHNGVRHGREGGHVGLVLMTPRAGVKRFLLRVFDDGPGVADEELPRLTERRYRGSAARTRAPGGAGLGLAIANDVCERHGFTLTLKRADVGGLEAEIAGPLLDAPPA